MLQNINQLYVCKRMTCGPKNVLLVLPNTKVRTHNATDITLIYLIQGLEQRVPWDKTDPYVLDRRNPRDHADIRAQFLEDLKQNLSAAMERCAGSAAAAKLSHYAPKKSV